MRIREFQSSDYEAACRLWKAADGMHPPTRDEVERKLERDRQLFLVAEDADELIGVVMGTYDGRRGWIFRLAVAQNRRRQGIGRALLTELEERYEAMGVTKVRLLTLADNDAGRAFWRRTGFDEYEPIVLYSKNLGDSDPDGTDPDPC